MSCYVLLLYYYTNKWRLYFVFSKPNFRDLRGLLIFFFAPKVTWHSGTRLYNLTP